VVRPRTSALLRGQLTGRSRPCSPAYAAAAVRLACPPSDKADWKVSTTRPATPRPTPAARVTRVTPRRQRRVSAARTRRVGAVNLTFTPGSPKPPGRWWTNHADLTVAGLDVNLSTNTDNRRYRPVRHQVSTFPPGLNNGTTKKWMASSQRWTATTRATGDHPQLHRARGGQWSTWRCRIDATCTHSGWYVNGMLSGVQSC